MSTGEVSKTTRKGGMGKNPFGGMKWLGKINLIDEVEAAWRSSIEQVLWTEVMKRAIQSFLGYGLADNHITAQSYFDAYEYLFLIRSDRPDTWSPYKTEVRICEENGVKRRRIVSRTDEEMKMTCFDRHYELAGFQIHTLEEFLDTLQDLKHKLLHTNRQQVQEYVKLVQCKELKKAKPGKQLQFIFHDPFELFLKIDRPVELAELLYYEATAKVVGKLPANKQRRAIRFIRAIQKKHKAKLQGGLFDAEGYCNSTVDTSGSGTPGLPG